MILIYKILIYSVNNYLFQIIDNNYCELVRVRVLTLGLVMLVLLVLLHVCNLQREKEHLSSY